MKEIGKLFFMMVFLLSGLHVFGQNGSLRFYAGTFTSEGAEGIYLCSLDTRTNEIKLENTFKGFDNPSFLKISPDRNFLYVVTRASEKVEPSGGYVSAYKIRENGSIEFLNKQISNGADPCHVDVSPDGSFVAIATYGGGTVSLYPTNPDGSLKPASSVIVNRGSGPIKERQSGPHAHSVKFGPWENLVFSADLGTDQLNIFYLESNRLVQHGQMYMKLDPGSGPRHFEFGRSGKVVFVINELSSTITSFEWNGASWVKKQTVSTVPVDYRGTNYCADIHLSKNGKYLYGSNRGQNSIAVFRADESDLLVPVGFVAVEGDWPRNFALTPDGTRMLVANQKSGNIAVFSINENTGMPEFTGREIKLPSPVCIEFLDR